MFASRSPLRATDIAIRAAIVGLALATGDIHFTLGGLLFTLNAIGYAATTIVGWAIQGPYFELAYIAKGIEVALIVLVAVDFARHDGNPVNVVRRELASAIALLSRRGSTAGARA